MSKNGLRMVVCLNFDITHLSAPSNNEKIEHELEGSDKWVMSKFGWTTILRPFLDIFERLPKTLNFFFEKLTPCTAKTAFENPKGPFGC